MLCGQAVVAIWNGIEAAGRQDFYEWHIREHMPERVGIPGFWRGRRYRAIDGATHPEFFTLYEVDTFEVLQGQDYAMRLNAPTAWTRQATAHFKDTSRGLARVLTSVGPGSGGALATIRFRVPAGEEERTHRALAGLMVEVAHLPLMTGAHLCRADDNASSIKTAESKGRTDITAAPNWFVLLEACTVEALEHPPQTIASACNAACDIGLYAHEYTRLKTDWAPG